MILTHRWKPMWSCFHWKYFWYSVWKNWNTFWAFRIHLKLIILDSCWESASSQPDVLGIESQTHWCRSHLESIVHRIQRPWQLERLEIPTFSESSLLCILRRWSSQMPGRTCTFEITFLGIWILSYSLLDKGFLLCCMLRKCRHQCTLSVPWCISPSLTLICNCLPSRGRACSFLSWKKMTVFRASDPMNIYIYNSLDGTENCCGNLCQKGLRFSITEDWFLWTYRRGHLQMSLSGLYVKVQL